MNGVISFPKPANAPLINFENGSDGRIHLQEAITKLRCRKDVPVLPLWIEGQPVLSKFFGTCIPPHDMNRSLATYAQIPNWRLVDRAIEGVLNAKNSWKQVPWHMRLHIFRKAAYLLEHKYFYQAVAVVMEDFSKNPYEAMIDVIELIDFWNFNAYFASQIYQEQPDSGDNDFNFMDYRPWEGFIAAIPPNNFVAIALNIPCAPLIMGNVVVCKPAPETIFSFHFMLNILHEAGLPPYTLAVLHGDEDMIGHTLLKNNQLSRVHFTGSVETMHKLIETMGKNISHYRGFPEVIGEAGGKNFMIIYDDADPEEAAAAIAQSAFGYQGRKCSALSRLYLTREMWVHIEPILMNFISQIRVGDVADFHNYLGAIISEQEYEKIIGYIEQARSDQTTVKIHGGTYVKNQQGYWIHPTIIVTNTSGSTTMHKEIFGPVLTVYPMQRDTFVKYLMESCNRNMYKLTGAVHTSNIVIFCKAIDELYYAAGNLYDCRTTGAVVNRQPFGGSGKSGSNSKPGSKLNLYRWINPRSISLTNSKPKHFAPAYLDRD